MKVKMLIAIGGMIAFVSCSGQQSSKSDQTAAGKAALPEMAEDEIREFGLVKQVEDAGYPFATLTIEFPERGFEEYFTLNMEEVEGVDPGVVNKWKGRYVEFYYTSSLSYALLDIRQNGVSLIGMNPDELPEGLRKASGTLDCPEEPSGDLPGTLQIMDAHADSYSFEFFITPEIINARGQLVEGYFEERSVNNITKIRPSKK